MTRVWEAAAYEDGPQANSWWAAQTPAPDCPVFQGNRKTDVAIIGAGFTGLNAALRLASAGVDVMVLEARHPYWGASGRNGGFCCLGGSKLGNAALRRKYGEQARCDWRLAERRAVDHVGDLLDRFAIDADHHSMGETLLAHRTRDVKNLLADRETIAQDYGVRAEFVSGADLAQIGMEANFHAALTTPIGFALSPRKYARGLLGAAQAAGAQVFGGTAVAQVTGTGPYQLHTQHGRVQAKKVIIATNGYSNDDLIPWMAGRTMPLQSAILATRPLTADEQATQGWTSLQMCYDSRHLLHYFRLMPDGRMVFGMRGGLAQTPRAVAANKRAIRAHFEQMFPAWAHVETPYYWSGLLCATRAQVPFAAQIPGAPGMFAAFGYHGNGVGMGSWCGALLADLAMDKTPDLYPDMLRRDPGRFPFGRYRRALMRPAYTLWGLQDL